MRYARSALAAIALLAAVPACDDEVLPVPTDASTSDRAAEAGAATTDASREAATSTEASTDASSESSTSTEGSIDDTDGGTD